MKRSRQFASLLVTAGLALLVVPAIAQSGSPAGTAGPAAPANRPNPNPGTPATPSNDRFQPRVDSTRPPSDASVNTAGQLDRDRPSSTSSTSVNPNYPNGKSPASASGVTAPGAVAGPNARASLSGQFRTLDRDSDDRISLNEFGAYTGMGVANAAGRSSTVPGGTKRNSTTSGNTATTETPGTLSGINDKGVTDTGASAASLQLFQQLDTNRDGYLSRTEINASSQPRTQP